MTERTLLFPFFFFRKTKIRLTKQLYHYIKEIFILAKQKESFDIGWCIKFRGKITIIITIILIRHQWAGVEVQRGWKIGK